MTEQSLYRRHRPQSFAEVVGQEHVVRTLSNAIERDRVHHAYLFVGSRGTGKTSMAKILAKSLNCVNGPTLTPCGVCESCVSIAAGGSMDVIEMDAASNRSVDDIRELRERVGYAPAAGSWKVYILDEAHMLTREAWNAFLKTLEEPPPNTVFVLATTEPHKVMPTIVDRCQRFDFARPSPAEIGIVLRRASAAESIQIDDGALGAIARAADGSFRDALGTLDQLVAYSGSEIETDDVLAVLGVADADLLFGAADAISETDGKAALEILARLGSSGRDPSRFAADLVAHLRQLLVVRTIGEVPEHFLVVAEHEARLGEQAARLDEVALVRAIDHLSKAIADIREGDEARMTVELALLRSARPEIDPTQAALLQRLERLEQGGAPRPAAAPAPIAPAAPAAPVDAPSEQVDVLDPAPAPAAEVTPPSEVPVSVTPVEEPAAHPPPANELLDLERLQSLWPAILDAMTQSGAGLLSAAIGAAKPVRLDPDASTLEIGFPPSAAFNRRKAEVKENRDRVAEAIRTVTGVSLAPVFINLDAEHDAGDGAAAQGGATAPPTEDEIIERLRSEFDATEIIEEPTDAEEAS